MSRSRGNRLLLFISCGVVVLLLGSGVLWVASRGFASNGGMTAVQNGETARTTPVVPTPAAAPNAATAEAPTTPEFHVVQPGESLYAIVRKYNTTVDAAELNNLVDALVELNNIENRDAIQVGQRLRLIPEEQ